MLLHPLLLIPVTVYVVLTSGEALREAVIAPPGIHVYEFAPDAVSITLEPAQIELVAGAIMIVGTGATTTWVVAVAVQPRALFPLIV